MILDIAQMLSAFYLSSKHFTHHIFHISSPFPQDAAQLVLHFIWWRTWCCTLGCVFMCLLLPSFRGKKERWAAGIFILIIKPNHLLKKLLPAAARESRTSLCSSSSIEQLQLSSTDHICAGLFAPCLDPSSPLLNSGDCVLHRLSSSV